jgi:DNA-binding MarR family transcriptional regulator
MLDSLELISVASVALTARALAETAGSELTFLAWRALVVVGSAEEPIRLSDLADRLGASRPSASKLVHRMARRGLLVLGGDPDDRRGVRLGPSEGGARLLQAVVTRRRQLMAEIVGDVPHGADEAGSEGTVTVGFAAARLSRWT